MFILIFNICLLFVWHFYWNLIKQVQTYLRFEISSPGKLYDCSYFPICWWFYSRKYAISIPPHSSFLFKPHPLNEYSSCCLTPFLKPFGIWDLYSFRIFNLWFQKKSLPTPWGSGNDGSEWGKYLKERGYTWVFLITMAKLCSWNRSGYNIFHLLQLA